MRPNQELHETFEETSTTIEKRQKPLYEAIRRMKPENIANEIFTVQEEQKDMNYGG